MLKNHYLPVIVLLSLYSNSFAQNLNDISNFIGNGNYETSIVNLDAHYGKKAIAETQPWSGDYWNLRSGSIAVPYGQGGLFGFNYIGRMIFNTPKGNKRHSDHRLKKILSDLQKNKLSEGTIDNLAPSEKYDLYLGDQDFSLTEAVWDSVIEHDEHFKGTSTWEGSCHGWSSAAAYSPRPTKMIKVPSLDGKYLIPFYPDDLKALSTLLWANSLIQDHTVKLGTRCKNKKPAKEDKTGKVLDPKCQGVDPGDFHVALYEMLAHQKKSFVVNRSNNTQIWNQPVVGFEIQYYNPSTEKEGNLTESAVLKNSFKDRFGNDRNPNTKYLVGVKMNLKYASETIPSQKKTDRPGDRADLSVPKEIRGNDKIKTFKLNYNLELDENYSILGGEWLNSSDPDSESEKLAKYPGFIWKFQSQNPVAYSVGDLDSFSNQPIQSIDRNLLLMQSKKAAAFTYNLYVTNDDDYLVLDENGKWILDYTAKRPQPLATVVNELVKLSRE